MGDKLAAGVEVLPVSKGVCDDIERELPLPSVVPNRRNDYRHYRIE